MGGWSGGGRLSWIRITSSDKEHNKTKLKSLEKSLEVGLVSGVGLGGKKIEFRPQTFTVGFRQQKKILPIEKTRF